MAGKTDNRRNRHDVASFRASPRLAGSLQRVLVDLIELQLQGKQAHWNVVGPNFRDLHLQLDELVDLARVSSDTVAERMRALDAVPDGRSETVSATTTVPAITADEINSDDAVDQISAAIYAAVETLREVREDVDDEDPNTTGVLDEVTEGLEKLAWLIKSENRKA